MLRNICIISFLIFSLSSYGQSELDTTREALEAGDYEVAYEKLLPLAEAGNPEAQYNLGVMYQEGLVVEQNYGKAVKWFRKAAEQGDVQAQYNLGGISHHGYGLQKDNVQAYAWAGIAAANGNTNAIQVHNYLEKHLTPNELEEARQLARELWEKYRNKNPDTSSFFIAPYFNEIN